MRKKLAIYMQYILPQHLLTMLMGKLAKSRKKWFKNFFIKQFMGLYAIDMTAALIENPYDYPDFNSFFTRKLKPHLRPIAGGVESIVSPADGNIAQIGKISTHKILQAKKHYFTTEDLLTDATLARTFLNGNFATFYLAPHNYHCVHMPYAGRLIKTIYVPGKLFSVNLNTSEHIANLYSRNERLICIFEQDGWCFAVILVGAMIVGGIKTIWQAAPIKAQHIQIADFNQGPHLAKGAEMGHFELGSTVILLFPEQAMQWAPGLKPGLEVNMGTNIGKISKI